MKRTGIKFRNDHVNECIKYFICLIIALTSVMGINVSNYHEFLIPHDSVAVRFASTVLLVLFISVGIYVLGHLIDVNHTCINSNNAFNPNILFVIVFFLNLILLLGYFPGTQSWDTYSQLIDFYDGTSTKAYPAEGGMPVTYYLNDHHPIITTLIFGLFSNVGRMVHDERLGIFLYSLLQLALFSYGYSRVLQYYNRKISGFTSWGVAFYYLLNPFLPYYAIMMLKDSLFSGLFLLYFLSYIKMYNEDIEEHECYKFFLLSLILPWMKKTGIYVVLISNIILFAGQIKKKYTAKTKAMILAGIIVPGIISFIIFPHIVFPMFDIFPGGKQEVLATLFQQSARVGIEYEDAYSEDEIVVLNRIFDYDSVDDIYDYGLTDPIKNTFKLKTVTDDDLHEYYKLWIKTGIEHPLSYLRATADTCAGYFAPVVKMSVYRENHTYMLTEVETLVVIRETANIIYDFFAKLPGMNILMYMVVYTWWLPFWVTYRLLLIRGGVEHIVHSCACIRFNSNSYCVPVLVWQICTSTCDNRSCNCL